MKKHLLATFIAASLLCAATANAAVITPVNRDAAGQGLNDPTAAAPVGGNPGTTVGEQRRIVYQFAADLWGAVLQSNVDDARGGELPAADLRRRPAACSVRPAPWYVNRDFTGAPVAGIWYHAALANAIAGSEPQFADPDYVVAGRHRDQQPLQFQPRHAGLPARPVAGTTASTATRPPAGSTSSTW